MLRLSLLGKTPFLEDLMILSVADVSGIRRKYKQKTTLMTQFLHSKVEVLNQHQSFARQDSQDWTSL